MELGRRPDQGGWGREVEPESDAADPAGAEARASGEGRGDEPVDDGWTSVGKKKGKKNR